MNGNGIAAVRSDGIKFNYENDDWALISVKGIDFPGIEVFSESKGFGDGDIITGIRRQSRAIELSCKIRVFKQDKYASIRALALGYHNIKYTYDIYVTYNGITKIAKNCVLKVASYPSERWRKNATMTLMFLSPEADLFADNADNVSFVTTTPLWHDTRVYQGAAGVLVHGEITKATEKVINYLGSEDAPIIVTVNATGYVNGLTIGCGDLTTNITTKLYGGDVLIIDTGERLVSKNGTPVPLSEYDVMELMRIVLSYGDNIVTVDSESTAYRAEVDYVGRYGGL